MKFRNLIGAFVLTIILFSGSILHAASVYYVDSGRPDDSGNGESWETAFKTIQAGIDEANINGSDGSPVDVRVKAGVYTPATQGNSFVLKPYVKLYGGFDGEEASFGDRDPSGNQTILSGDINGDDQWIDNWGNTDGATSKGTVLTDSSFNTPENGWTLDPSMATDNCTIVISIPAGSSLDSNFRLDGFIVTGGFNNTAESDVFGSGILIDDDNSVMTISNTVISGNIIRNTADAAIEMSGAGVCIKNSGNTVDFSSCTLTANALVSEPTTGRSRLFGAAIFNNGGWLSISGSTMDGNISRAVSVDDYIDISGGAIYNAGDNVTIENSTFMYNMGSAESYDDARVKGSAVYNDYDADNLSISNSTFKFNSIKLNAEIDFGDAFGAAIYNRGSGMAIADCTITGNNAMATSQESFINTGGIGLHSAGDNLTVSNTVIDANTVSATAKRFAYLDGTGFCNIGDYLDFSNSSVSYNVGNITSTEEQAEAEGGGCKVSSRSAKMYNCSINNNTVNVTSLSTDSSDYARCEGGGLFLWLSPFEIVNSTISGNQTTVTSDSAPGTIKGGGLYNDNDLLMVNTTMADNKSSVTSTSGDVTILGGGYYQETGGSQEAFVINSIFWGNDITATSESGSSICNGPQAYDAVIRHSVVEYGYPTGTDIITSSPLLGVIADNGGNTETMAITSGSSAFNAGVVVYTDNDDTPFYSVPSTSSYKKVSDDSDYAPTSTDTILNSTDQRGAERPQLYFSDIGSYELGGSFTVTFTTDESGGGILSGETNQIVTYYHNTSVVAAVPSGGFEFTEWTGDYTITGNPLTLKNVTASMALQANFTRVSPDFPTVTTEEVTDINYTGAVSGGEISADAWSDVAARGICYSTDQVPTIDNSKTIDGEGTGSFSSTLENLEAGTTYYLRAYATNSSGTAYGDQISFTTETTTPEVTTADITALTETTAQSGGNVTSVGGADVTVRGICWSTSENPTTDDAFSENETGTGEFTSDLTELEPATTYYARAFATNSNGTVYGDQITFTTLEKSGSSGGGSSGGCFIGVISE